MKPSVAPVQVQKCRGSDPGRAQADFLAVEEPLEIRVSGRSLSVTMRTPGHDRELAAGFLLTEGVVRGRRDVVDMTHCNNAEGQADENVLHVALNAGVAVDFEKLTRHVFASSSCGVCGKATIESVRGHFPPVVSKLGVARETLYGLPARLGAAQETFKRTGGLHASALFDERGELLVLREDVGRHNALDKVIGWAFFENRLPLDAAILLVSGRVSFEIVQKGLAAGIPVVAAISAPSSLAVELAEESGVTLVGFLRGEQMNVYAHGERIHD